MLSKFLILKLISLSTPLSHFPQPIKETTPTSCKITEKVDNSNMNVIIKINYNIKINKNHCFEIKATDERNRSLVISF